MQGELILVLHTGSSTPDFGAGDRQRKRRKGKGERGKRKANKRVSAPPRRRGPGSQIISQLLQYMC